MKTRLLLVPLVLVMAALTPVRAETMLFAQRADMVHVNVYRPLGTGTLAPPRAQAGSEVLAGTEGHAGSEAAPEVSMFFGKLDILADPNGWGYPEEGGCIDIFNAGVIDVGCGPLTVVADGTMGTTTVQGTLETTAYTYSAEEGFVEIGPSQIVVDLTVAGDGPVELSPYTNYAVGVCGLPPDTRGVYADGRPELQRTAAMTGTLSSQYAGDVAPETLPTLLVQAFNVLVGACV